MVRPNSTEDAEDLVSETTFRALKMLPEFRAETGRDGLRSWLRRILMWVALEDRKRKTREIETTPLAGAQDMIAQDAEDRCEAPAVEAIRTLPPGQRMVVREWLAGDSQIAIARRHRLHRNTVANRLSLAFQHCAPLCRMPACLPIPAVCWRFVRR